MALHEAPWNVPARITERFRIRKVETSLQDYEFDTTFDLVYSTLSLRTLQPELWTADVFRRIFDILSEGGLLVTYSAKGTVKRNLREAGIRREAPARGPRQKAYGAGSQTACRINPRSVRNDPKDRHGPPGNPLSFLDGTGRAVTGQERTMR